MMQVKPTETQSQYASSSHQQQLYKGEKARNQVLERANKDLKLQLATYGDEIKQIENLKIANKEYSQLILKYETQSKTREIEYNNM